MQSTMKYTAALAVLGVVVLAACGSGGGKSAAPVQLTASPASATGPSTAPSIVVAGHGKVEGTPDVMTVTMGVQTTDPFAQNALERNNQRAQSLIDTLKSHGVDAKDIQTIDLNVSPNYDKDGHVTGYSASNTVVAKLRDLTKAGAVIDAAATTVGNDIRLQGVEFSIDDTSGLIAKASADAVKDAIAQGNQLAAAANIKLGAVRTIDDTGSYTPVMKYSNLQDAGVAARAFSSVPVEAGTQELTVDVNVVFDIG